MSEHDDDRLRELGTQLPWVRPDAATRDAVRSSLLIAATTERDNRTPTRWYIVGGAFAAGALAAAAAALLLFGNASERPAPSVSATRIEASPAAQFDREVTRTTTGVDEVVRLRSGSLEVSVGAMRAGDHVRVATRDAEVEGEGSYAVDVISDQLQAVTVKEGHATIRMTGQRAVFLSSGQAWKANTVIGRVDVPVPTPAPIVDEPAVVVDSAPVVKEAKPRASQPQSMEKPEPESLPEPALPTETAIEAPPAPVVTAPGTKEVERRFQAGMAMYKAGKSAEAARELLAAADAGGDDPLAADARYFAASALTKAGRKTEAERAFIAFIDRAPNSIRRGRAAVMLARLIAERGDSASARAWFESALGDSDASVVAAAKAGIASLR